MVSTRIFFGEAISRFKTFTVSSREKDKEKTLPYGMLSPIKKIELILNEKNTFSEVFREIFK